MCLVLKLMETSGTDILNDSDVRAPVSPLHLAVSTVSILFVHQMLGNIVILFCFLAWVLLRLYWTVILNHVLRHIMDITRLLRYWFSLCWIWMWEQHKDTRRWTWLPSKAMLNVWMCSSTRGLPSYWKTTHSSAPPSTPLVRCTKINEITWRSVICIICDQTRISWESGLFLLVNYKEKVIVCNKTKDYRYTKTVQSYYLWMGETAMNNMAEYVWMSEIAARRYIYTKNSAFNDDNC